MASLMICILLKNCSVDTYTCSPDLCHATNYSGGRLMVTCGVYDELNLFQLQNSTIDITSVAVEGCTLPLMYEDFEALAFKEINKLSLISTRLPDGSLTYMSPLHGMLTDLTISGCELTDYVLNTLPSMDVIRHLNFSKNLLRTLPHFLNDYALLTTLDISYNELVTMDASALSMNLVEIFAQHNSINSVTFSQNLFNLEILNLSYNKLENLDWMVQFSFPATCEVINLQGNKITNLTLANLHFLSFLNKFDLSENSITTLDESLGKVQDLSNNSVNLAGNRLVCSCKVAQIAASPVWQSQQLPPCTSIATNDNKTYHLSDFKKLFCNNSDESGKQVDEIDKEQLGVAAAIFIIGGMMCGVLAVAALGYLVQQRRMVITREDAGMITKANFSQQSSINRRGNKQSGDDIYLYKREHDIDSNLEKAAKKLGASESPPCALQSTIRVTLEVTMIHVLTTEVIDIDDICAQIIREWPLAPCTTPLEEFDSMYYEGEMEEFPMTPLQTRTCSNTSVTCVLNEATKKLQTKSKGKPNSPVKHKGSFQPLVPPNSVISVPPKDSNFEYPINNLESW